MAAGEVTALAEADRLAVFATLQEGFARAGAQVGIVEQDHCIAGFNVRLRFAGPALIPALAPALAHLARPPRSEGSPDFTPDFTIDVFDCQSTATPLPFLLARFIDLLRLRWWELLDKRRELKGLNSERIRAVFHLGPDILSLLDTERSRGIYWVQSADAIPYYEKGYPLSVLLNWWLARQGRYFMHAAALGSERGGVLLTGKGGSGKSTTTLACLRSGLRIAGDDYAAVDPAAARAYSLYNTIKLKGLRDVQRFPELRPCISNLERVRDGEEGEKAMLFLHEHFPEELLPELPLRAILVPRIVEQPHTTITPTSAALAFKALAPSTVFQLPGNEHAAFQALVQMVRRIPSYEIALGSDIGRIPEVIARFLEQP